MRSIGGTVTPMDRSVCGFLDGVCVGVGVMFG